MSYIPFTQQQREQARRTDLAAFLRQCGEKVKKSGSEFCWLDHGQKVTIRGNLWFHQYEQVGGDAIDFACRFYGMDYPDAVQLMLSMGVGTVQGTVEPFARQPLELPPKHENMRRVYGYLIRRRGIGKDVLDAFAYRGLVYESADYHNAVFVGTDREGKPRHIHKHSTAAQGGFKGNAPGSEPEYSFRWIGGGDTLLLFEAPIDMLSFISMHKQNWKSYSYATACGVSDKVLWQTLKDRPYIRKVCICLDNDEVGRKAAQRISKALSEKNMDELREKASTTSADFDHIDKELKSAEQRLVEIAALKKHIINYAKTREAYVQYRKAGYSKAFFEAHREEITLHKAAKDAFQKMGVSKLPKVKELSEEYATVLEQKKSLYAQYRLSREEMREYQKALHNTEVFFDMDRIGEKDARAQSEVDQKNRPAK